MHAHPPQLHHSGAPGGSGSDGPGAGGEGGADGCWRFPSTRHWRGGWARAMSSTAARSSSLLMPSTMAWWKWICSWILGSSNDYRNPMKSCRCTMIGNTATQLNGILTASIKLEEIYKARHKAVRKHVDSCVVEYHWGWGMIIKLHQVDFYIQLTKPVL